MLKNRLVAISKSRDFPAMAELYNRAIAPFREVYSDEEKTAFGDSLRMTATELAEQAESRHVVCFKKDNVCCGFAVFRNKNAQTVWISSVYVDPTYQRRGVGRALLQTIEDHARNNSLAIVALETHAKADWAIQFYLRNGYVLVNDKITLPPYGGILDRPPVAGRPILAKSLTGEYLW